MKTSSLRHAFSAALTLALSGGAAHAQFATLDDPLGTNGTFANGISSNGTIVEYYKDAGSNTVSALRWQIEGIFRTTHVA